MLYYNTYLLRYTAYIYNVVPEDGLDSPKHVQHPKIKTGYKNLCILLVHLHNVITLFNLTLFQFTVKISLYLMFAYYRKSIVF